MAIDENVLQIIMSKFYNSISTERQQVFPKDIIKQQIEKYFAAGSKSYIEELQVILDNFNSEDNPYIIGVSDKKEPAASWLWKQVRSFFTEMFPSVWQGYIKNIDEGISEYGLSWITKMIGVDQKAFKGFLDNLQEIGFLDDTGKAHLTKLYDETGNVNPLIWLFLLLGYGFTILQIMSGTIGGDYIKKQNAIYTPGVPTAESLIHGLRVAPELKDRFIKAFKENGLSDNDIELMLISAYNVYDVDTIRQLYLRGTISNDKMIERLGELGYTPERQQELISLWDIIPPVNDILYMVAKEAFEPEEVARLGLSAEFPEEVSSWLTKQGLSRHWQEKYWQSHWAMPSIQQAFEMYHRSVIDDDMLNSLFKTVELPPLWRDKLKAIAYNPYTRVDIRRMHLMGTVTIEEVYRNYLDLGYDSEHAEKMTEWTIAYNEQGERTVTREQIESGYRDEVITRKEAYDWMVSLGYSETTANFSLDYVDYEEEKSYQDNIIDVVKDSFSANLMSREEASRRLMSLDLTTQKIEYLLERWTIRKIANRKLPSKTDLEKLLKNDIITLDDYKGQLRIIGYEEKYIEWYAKLQVKGMEA